MNRIMDRRGGSQGVAGGYTKWIKKDRFLYRQDLEKIAPYIKDFLPDKQCYEVIPNPILVHTMPYQLVFDEAGNDSFLLLPLNGQNQNTMNNDEGGTIDIHRFKATATSTNCLIQIRDDENKRDLCSRAVHYETILGNGLRPFDLVMPLTLHKTEQLTITGTDLSGAANTLRFAFEGQRYYFDSDKEWFNKTNIVTRFARPYFYTTDEDVTLAVGATQTSYITIIAEADFFLSTITARSTGPFLIKSFDLTTQAGYSNSWVHSDVFAGNAQFYRRLKTDMIIQRHSKLKLDIRNLHVAPNDIYITLSGWHWYGDVSSI